MVLEAVRPVAPNETDRGGCRHHWLIDAPTGPTSNGTCRLCGESRQFKNYVGSEPRVDAPGADATTSWDIPASSAPTEDEDEEF